MQTLIERLSQGHDDCIAELLMREAVQEIERLTVALRKAEARACAMEHPKSQYDERDEVEMFLRDAFAAGCKAAQERSLFVAMEYAKREAPRLRALLVPNVKVRDHPRAGDPS